jgi:hypothetical protein
VSQHLNNVERCPQTPAPPEFQSRLWELVWTIRNDVKHLRETKDDHEGRIRKVEKRLAWAAGAAAVIGFLMSKFLG